MSRQNSRPLPAASPMPPHAQQTHLLAEHGRTTSRRHLALGQQQQQTHPPIDYGQSTREREGAGEKEMKYVVYLRLPFPRGAFVDPPQVDWNANKERVLWRILSRTTRNQGIDWNQLAQQFQVSRAFLLQQAAWLYERELSQVRAQMRKGMGGAATIALSPNNQNVSTGAGSPRPLSPASAGIPGGARMVRTGSGGSYDPKAYSSVSIRTPGPPFARPAAAGTPTAATRPMALPMSRTPSTATARPSSQASVQPAARFANPISQNDLTNIVKESPPRKPCSSDSPPTYSDSGDGDDDDSDDDDSDDSTIDSKGKGGIFNEDDEIYLPFSRTTADSSSMDEDELGTATLTNVRRRGEKISPRSKEKIAGKDVFRQESEKTGINPRKHPSEAGSTSTAKQGGVATATAPRDSTSQKNRLTGSGGPGAESSPSMGSSFSDLSDASISQSAMEDAYLSNMHAAGMASRMSVLGQAVRSRYFSG
ncbi:hypothetical protein BDZ91DRAFT_719955 [Kalaharituber pfeilii]|nr:hypothetical protein BDZ91DRAFT_719955 [Kalaharituber pfeilii]